MKVWLDGKLVDEADAKISVFDHGLLYGDGVFEGIRAYHGSIFQCQAHLDRLFESAEIISLDMPYTRQQLRDATYETLRANKLDDSYIRMVITRGKGTLGLNPKKCSEASAFIITGNIKMYPEEMYRNGMPVIIGKTIRTSVTMFNPAVKSLNYLNNIMAKLEGIAAGVEEVLMTNDKGNIAEASGDNVFIIKDGVLMTPPKEAGILLGVTRSVVMHMARKLGMKVLEINITPKDVYQADECFLTGTAAEVISVTSVDGKIIGCGKAGAVTQKIRAAFKEFVKTDEQIPYIG
ncbi:MAG TPA: branched-chain-amino-acid transaminase [Phycisphaerae bacterium]|nr:branched-chain-amino-acid transaminase [Phycisphaerae bacterium]HPS53818.1 branched-chain-amino-acid transaminase [Phycisphaerae bacterium]